MQDSPIKYSRAHLIKVLALATIIVSILGYFDCVTGEISIDILYILCICFVTWHSNTFIGILSVVETIFAKTMADYYDQIKIGSHLYEWNTLNYIFIYLITCVLVGKLKKVLTK